MNARFAPPLEGVRVLDLTTFLSGPYATQILGDLGADVVKLEPPGGDSSRSIPPYFVGDDSAYFYSTNRNKRSMVADLKSPEGRRLLNDLADRADIVVENFRPGVVDRLGLSYQDLRTRNPAVVWCSISGFGQDGPYRDRPAYDMVVQALSGGMSMTGVEGGPPVRAGIPVGDLSAGMYGVVGILAALHQRARTGVGRQIDIAMLDCQVAMLSYQGVYHLLAGAEPGRQGRGHDSIPTYRAFTASDGNDVIVTANTERMWRSLATTLDRADLLDDPRFASSELRQAHRDELTPMLDAAFTARPAAQWLVLLQESGVPVAPVHTVAEALADPHVRGRDMVVTPDTDPTLRLVGDPVKFTDSVPHLPRRPPRLDEHAKEVLAEWLGKPA